MAALCDGRTVFYIDDKDKATGQVVFYHTLNERVLLLKLMPGMDGAVLERLFPYYDAVVIEAFGVGGLPEYGEVPFYAEIRRWTDAGKIVMMATQVTHEGSDMEVYKVGRVIKENFHLMEAYDMTLDQKNYLLIFEVLSPLPSLLCQVACFLFHKSTLVKIANHFHLKKI